MSHLFFSVWFGSGERAPVIPASPAVVLQLHLYFRSHWFTAEEERRKTGIYLFLHISHLCVSDHQTKDSRSKYKREKWWYQTFLGLCESVTVLNWFHNLLQSYCFCNSNSKNPHYNQVCNRASLNSHSPHIEPWSKWITVAKDQARSHSCQLICTASLELQYRIFQKQRVQISAVTFNR